ncbi:PTS sugar transporter subunit IIA [Paraclostridium ghonii]|uniref:PTS sugar transporter subunit IIA n=1 Tax=Paraclostridium ghonii TaxID=29358 RepID=UPI00202CD574|nr:PTS sugar transporter subunit IIA [Paeniclostridium ghonii]MCM0166715.1 PTS sugar transporter subunit IIA [Paeniclostridium ghonii]
MIIITGHGKFASGLKSSLNLIVGDYEFIKVVDFTEDKTPEKLKEEIKYLVKSCLDKKIYMFTDLGGGTPHKISSELALENRDIEVFCGTNLPMLVESVMMISLDCELDIDLIKETGMNSIKPKNKMIEFCEEGI